MTTIAKQSLTPLAIRSKINGVASGEKFFTKSAAFDIESNAWTWSARVYVRVGKTQRALVEVTGFMGSEELDRHIAANHGTARHAG